MLLRATLIAAAIAMAALAMAALTDGPQRLELKGR
jgi:hypothetical protein